MPHIELPEGLPGIVGPMVAYPETEKHLNGLADALLRGPSSLSPGERETIAAYVSKGNQCRFWGLTAMIIFPCGFLFLKRPVYEGDGDRALADG
jgi:hypothetical protein